MFSLPHLLRINSRVQPFCREDLLGIISQVCCFALSILAIKVVGA